MSDLFFSFFVFLFVFGFVVFSSVCVCVGLGGVGGCFHRRRLGGSVGGGGVVWGGVCWVAGGVGGWGVGWLCVGGIFMIRKRCVVGSMESRRVG